jgi:hypothetical protein
MQTSIIAGQPLQSSSEPEYLQQWSLHNVGQEVNGKTGKVNADINWKEGHANI